MEIAPPDSGNLHRPQTPTRLRVLIVEDSPIDAELILLMLERQGFELDYQRVEDEAGCRAELERGCDLVLSDWNLPQFSGLRALNLMQSMGLDLPFIIISGNIGEEAAVEALRQGAYDYLLKDRLHRLGQAVSNALERNRLRIEQKRVEKLLHIQSAALNAAANAIIITDTLGLIEWANPAFAEQSGYSLEESLGKNTNQLIRSGLHDAAFYQEMWQTIQAGRIWRGEITNRRKNGELYIEEMTITPIRDAEGQITNFIAIKQDITQRKQTEQALFQSQSHYRNLVEMSPDSIFINRANRIEFANPAALELFGATLPQDILGRSPFEFFLPEYHDLIRSRINHMLVYQEPVPLVEEKLRQLDGTVRDVEVIAAPFIDSTGGAVQVIMRDITDRKQAEELLREKSEELAVAYGETLEGWSRALELREHETAGHSRRVVDMTLTLSRALGVPEEKLVHMQRGALLHDIGKMGIPDSILLKPGPLTDDEWVIMRQHPIYAHRLLSRIPFLAQALEIPYCHHEKWDGTGYPRQLKGEEIPLAGRIFAVIDVWDALSYARPYRPAWTEEAIRHYLREQSGKHFDPRVVDTFLEILNGNGRPALYPLLSG